MPHKCEGCKYKSEHEEMGFRPIGVCTRETNLIEAEKAYNAEVCKYDQEHENAVCISDKEQKDIEQAVAAFQAVAQAICDIVTPYFDAALKVVKKLWETVMHTYPDKRVIHLALHHPKERVRKKNINRISRWIKRGCRQ